mmetsp:Transcript_92416/g.298711  ORF Transcript_92416/g.298711 Transcript_92416/m.298711 type:complete len:99 (-) Transcript_92416:1320-1616(-)
MPSLSWRRFPVAQVMTDNAGRRPSFVPCRGITMNMGTSLMQVIARTPLLASILSHSLFSRRNSEALIVALPTNLGMPGCLVGSSVAGLSIVRKLQWVG